MIFVYGTLRKGGIYHHLIKDAVLVKENYCVSGFKLYDFQHWYPYMVRGESVEDYVIGEIYQVDSIMLQKLHILEDIEHEVYRFEYLPDHQVYTYLKFDDQVANLIPVAGGDWIKYINRISKNN